MDRERRIELGCVAGSIVVAGTIAICAEPFPPLARYIESDAWTRSVEFVILLMVLWMLMSAVGLVRAKIEVGLDGLSAERLSQSTSKNQKALADVRQDLDQLQGAADDIGDELGTLTSTSLADHDKRIVALEDRVKMLSSVEDPDSPEAPDV